MTAEAALTNDQIRAKGLELLAENLGPVGMIRFLQQTETGWGDYTRDRQNWLGKPDVNSITAQMTASQKNAD